MLEYWQTLHAYCVPYLDQLQYATRDVSPYAMYAAGLAVLALGLFLITKWKEFMMIGLTAGIYVIPFLTSGLHKF